MRIRGLLRGAALIGVCGLGWVAPARAQFEAPNPEELKMTADPKAPGADAVYLYREEIADDRRSVYSLYERIKILTEKGRDLATVKIPYEKGMINVTGIEGRTIHADGTVVPLTEKPENLVAVKTKGYQENTIVFTLPSVETGSILEYRLQMRYNESLLLPPSWDIQQAYYVHKAHYEFYPGRTGQFGPSRLMWVLTPRDAKVAIVQGKGVFTIDVADVPPVPDDDWMPPLNTFREHVQFYYSYASSGDEFWRNAGNFWASSLDQFIKPSVKLKSIVEGIVAAGDTDEQKAREIYAAVIRLENTMLSGEKTEAERKKEKIKEIRSAEDVWRDQGGTANQIALLYVALARAAGLKAWPMFIAPRDERIFDPTYFYMDQLSDYIVVLDLGGRTVYLDPGQKTCSFGQLAWMHTLAGGLRMNENGARIDYTPAANYRDNSTERTANLAVDATGIVTGQVRVFFSGDEAAYWRQVALENGAGELEKQITGSLQDDLPDGVNASFDHFVSLDDYESRMMAVFRVSGTMGSPEGKYFILPGLFFESRAKVPFVAQSSRTTPIDLHFPMMETDEVDYTLPPGYTVESSPEFPDLTWPRYAVMRIDSGTGNGELTVKRMFARDFAFLGPESYSDLRGFYQKVAAADQQQIVLTRAAAQKGN